MRNSSEKGTGDIRLDKLFSNKLSEFLQRLIVPPTWNKAQYHDQLESVWRAAADELIDAENIFISGYSLPPTDHFFRYLYALGTMGKARLKRFWVFDPDKGVGERFMDLLGPLASSRFRFDYATFNQAIGMIRTKLNLGGSGK